MASDKEYLNFILDQFSGLEGISYRAMMGEYIIYYNGKIIGGIYDNRFLVKPVKAAEDMLPGAKKELPYEGGKEMLLVEDVDNRELLRKLPEAMYGELPDAGKKQKKSNITKERTEIQNKLFELQDKEYAKFQSRLTPNIAPELFIGVRVPECRKLAKELYRNERDEVEAFFGQLPHKYYDENMLHGLLISEIRDYGECIEALEAFLPYVDNWAVCDIMSPKCFKKHREELFAAAKKWTGSSREYTIRFGIEMIMSHYLDEDFRAECNETVAAVRSDKYYVNMMIAWYFATALTKQWDSTVEYIERGRLDCWTHNKTIQKACESYRITSEQKSWLRTLKRKP